MGILQVAHGFIAVKHLFAANEAGLVEALVDVPATWTTWHNVRIFHVARSASSLMPWPL
jgi:hypothetical protein